LRWLVRRTIRHYIGRSRRVAEQFPKIRVDTEKPGVPKTGVLAETDRFVEPVQHSKTAKANSASKSQDQEI